MNYCGIDPHANNCVVIVSDDEDRSTPVSGRLRVGRRCPFRVGKRRWPASRVRPSAAIRDVDSTRLAGYHTRVEDRQSRLMVERARREK